MTKIRQKIIIAILALILIASAILSLNSAPRKAAAVSPNYAGPRITVLTPGLGGSASHWSNAGGTGGGTFVQDGDSLVNKLRLKGGLSYIFRAETTGGDTPTPDYNLYSYYSNNEATIQDASKHIVIVFESRDNSNASNEVVYNEFRNMLNKVISTVETLDHGRPTKVNLIGHSRGGITNLQYALDFPNKVHTMISIGTPYFGSEAAKQFGSLILGASDGLNDICNAARYDNYYQRWTTGYESKYKNINSIAIGSITSVEYQIDVLKLIGGDFAAPLATLLERLKTWGDQILTKMFLDGQYKNFPEIQKYLTEDQFYDLVRLVDGEIHFGVWYSDVLVPIDSQQGISGSKNYKFTKHVKEFKKDDTEKKLPKLATNKLAIIHNLETYDADLHKYILDNIVTNDGQEATNEISNVARPSNYAWSIKIRNTHSEGRTYEYNSKMCFEGDAKNWTGLTDVKSIWLEPNTSTIVNIEGHLAATHIAVSSILNGKRYIQYAHGLYSDYNVFKMTTASNTIDIPPDNESECIAEGSLITLADGSQKAVEELTGDEMLLVWNLQTGAFDVAPILFIDSDATASYEIIELEFSDGTEVEVIYEHGFWDITLNRYVYLRNDAEDYIGHWFNKQSIDENGNMIWTQVQLEEVEIEIEQTTAWSPVTAVHLCYYVNGMLSMPGGIEGLFNIFEVDSATMKYDAEAMAEDIATYGLFTYEEFSAQVEISQDVFDAFGGQYLKVAIGKGQIDMQTIATLLDRYSEFLN